MDINQFKYIQNSPIDLSKIDTAYTDELRSKEEGKFHLKSNIKQLVKLQSKLYANDKYAILIIFQAMDTAGKDGAIKHVMRGLNPQATKVHSFKQPSVEEINHDYLWRASKNLPERGQIGIFNRSYYEDVLVVKVHDLLKQQKIPKSLIAENIWENRYRQIRNFEKHLFENGIITIKFFLHISKEEQKNRLLARIEDTSKNWKFSSNDIDERQYWNNYMKCYQEAIMNTSTEFAPWHIIPSDKKWFARFAISEIIKQNLENLKIDYPTLSKEQYKKLNESKYKLLNE